MQQDLLTLFENSRISVGDFVYYGKTTELKYNNALVKIEPQLLQFLLLLIHHQLTQENHIVSRDILLDTVWKNKTASDDAIRAGVKKLRDVLKDDARKPTYIKTVPTKGYLLIADVKIEDLSSGNLRRKWLKYFATVSLIICSTLMIQQIFTHYYLHDSEESVKPIVTVLEEFTNNEVGVYLHSQKEIVFTRVMHNQTESHLFKKNLNSAREQRLTWQQVKYNNPIVSPNAEMIAVHKFEKDTHSVLLLKSSQGSQDLQATRIPFKTDIAPKLLGFTQTNDAIVFVDKQSVLPLGQYDILANQLKYFEIDGLNERNIQNGRLSLDDKYVALTTQNEKGKHLILVVELNHDTFTGSLVRSIPITQPINNIVWDSQSTYISWLDNQQSLVSANIFDGKRSEWIGMSMRHANLLSNCGEGCFILRDVDTNYLNINEVPNPFMPQSYLSGEIIDSGRADNFPMYTSQQDRIVYALNKNNITRVYEHSKNSPDRELFIIPGSEELQSIAVNKQGDSYIGQVGKRVFLYRQDLGTFSFVSRINQIAQYPTWSWDGESFTYSVLNDGVSVLYEYDLANSINRKVADNTAILKEISVARSVHVDDNNNVALVSANDPSDIIQSLGALPHLSPNRWHVKNGYLYYLKKDDVDMMFYRIELSTGIIETRNMAEQHLHANFDLSADGSKLLVVTELNKRSKLIKVTGLQSSIITND